VERFALRITAPAEDGGSSASDDDSGRRAAAPDALAGVPSKAYRSVPLSQMAPLGVIPPQYRDAAKYDTNAAAGFDD
jgi:hypothetical protein